MSSLQQRIAAVTDTTANLIAQLRELDRLREQVRKALLSARKSPQPKPNWNGAIPPSHWQSTDTEPALGHSGPPESAAAAHRQAAPRKLGSANKTLRPASVIRPSEPVPAAQANGATSPSALISGRSES